MADAFVRAVIPESGAHVTVSAVFADLHDLELVDEPVFAHGELAPACFPDVPAPVEVPAVDDLDESDDEESL